MNNSSNEFISCSFELLILWNKQNKNSSNDLKNSLNGHKNIEMNIKIVY